MSARILLVGSGGREHALAWKLAQSPNVDHIFAIPGNGGTARLGQKVSNITSVSADDFEQLLKFAVDQKVNLLVPGPEAPLVDGITDYFAENGPDHIDIFGPSRMAARMEGSKAFSKRFMKKYNIPTAAFETFTSFDAAKAFLEKHKDKEWVIKADGLAAGKGVILPASHEEAVKGLSSIMQSREFGAAGDQVVIEELLRGEEVSILSLSDGRTVRSLPAAQDHKRSHDGDQGLNTGGMGCYAPTGVVTEEVMQRIHHEAIEPTIKGMRHDRYPFVGCLFTGFMITKDGPKVLEYNVRFGDPESQTLLPLLDSDLYDIMQACCNENLDTADFRIKPEVSTTVVVAAGGYPGTYDKGLEMTVDPPQPNTYHFHAGTNLHSSTRKLTTSGGRVIASTAIGSTILEAVERAYTGVKSIKFPHMHFRTDIAHHELSRHNKTPTTRAPVNGLTYASSGVSITAGNDLVSRIKPLVKATARPGIGATIGGFGGDIDLAAAGYPATSPRIIAAIDGIGTKVRIAQQAGDYSTVGIDLVAMNVNDLIVQGATPLAFLDYYACGRLDVDAAAAFVKGVADGCKQALCGLIGGETAEMPSLYADGDFDAAGCAIGALAHDARVLPVTQSMVEGDVLLGLGSSGCHSNGFSLVRRIVERSGLKYSDRAPWEDESSGKTVAQALLTPTRIYVKSLLEVLSRTDDPSKPLIKGMAHITGGGLLENIPRMLPESLEAKVSVDKWPVPPVLKWLKKNGAMEHGEFSRTFNTGLGMVLVVDGEMAASVAGLLQGQGEEVYAVGSLQKRTSSAAAAGEGHEGVVLEGLEAWDNL